MIIKAENIVKDYNKKMRALKGVSIEVPSGVYGLIGRNGAGKTTLLRIMASVMQPTSGDMYFDEKKVNSNLKEYDYQAAEETPWFLMYLPYIITAVVFIAFFYFIMRFSRINNCYF